jgi:PAS domain S-box-containing protein
MGDLHPDPGGLTKRETGWIAVGKLKRNLRVRVAWGASVAFLVLVRAAHAQELAGDAITGANEGASLPRDHATLLWTAGSLLLVFALAVVVLTVSILRQRRAEHALRQSEATLRSIFTAAPAGIGLVVDRVLRQVNDRLCEMVGRQREELLGRNARVVYPTREDYEFVGREKYRQISETGTGTVETRFLRSDGEIIDVILSSTPLDPGDLSRGVTFTAVDITARKQAERDLAQSQASLARAQEVGHIGSWTLEIGNNELIWSDETYRIFGRELGSSPLGFKEFLDLVHPEDRDALLATRQYAERGEPFQIDHRILVGGREKWVREIAEVECDDDGRPIRRFGVVQDITDRKRAELEIRQLNADLERRVLQRTEELQSANRELEAFAYSVSHDLRAPLRSMDGFSQALLEDHAPALDSTGKDYLKRVQTASHRMGALIDDILALSRATRSEMTRTNVDLSALADSILHELSAEQPARQVRAQVSPGLMASGDARLLRVALRNLLHNAWKFTSRRAEAEISVGSEIVGNGAPPAQRGKTAFFVRDNGVGFEMAYADKLFQAFRRLHSTEEFPGTGIGLATVQRIVRRHGGNVWAAGCPGQGTTVWFTLNREPTGEGV